MDGFYVQIMVVGTRMSGLLNNNLHISTKQAIEMALSSLVCADVPLRIYSMCYCHLLVLCVLIISVTNFLTSQQHNCFMATSA